MKKRMGIVAALAVLMATSAYAQKSDFFELVKTGTPQDVQAAIVQGANVNARDKSTDENWQDKNDKTPLMYAAGYNQNPEVITALLKAGANIKAQDLVGRTALICAAMGNPNPEVITTLLKAGANIKAQDVVGMTSLMYAAAHNQNPEVVSTLLKAGANIKARAKGMLGRTVLAYAAVSNPNAEVIATLLEAGADIEARDELGGTALLSAAANNQNPEVVSTLLKAGAAIEARNEYGTTPLMGAAYGNPNPEVITTLLKAGADAKAKDSAGKTAFDLAQENEKLKGDAYWQAQVSINSVNDDKFHFVGSVRELPDSFGGDFLDVNYKSDLPDGFQVGWLIAPSSAVASDLNNGRVFAFKEVSLGLWDGVRTYFVVIGEGDEAMMFQKIDFQTIRIIDVEGSQENWRPVKTYTLKRKEG
jgi:ankyrin repeat protein